MVSAPSDVAQRQRWPGLRVVMTGAGGFFGAHLLARLVGARMSMTIVDRDIGESRYTAWMVAAGKVRFVRYDSRFMELEVARALQEADVLVLSGLLEPSSSSATQFDPGEIDRTVAPLARLVDAFARKGKHIVLASSDYVYGAPERNPVREFDPIRPRTGIGLTHAACEKAVRGYAEVGATASVLRYATIYGPGETATRAVANLIRAALAGRAVVEDDELDEHDYLHVADAVDATVSALRLRADGIYNVGTGIGTTMAELANLVWWLTGCSGAPIRGAREWYLPRRSVVLDTSRAHSDLAFRARHALPDGLKEEIGWFKAAFGSDLKSAA